MRSQISINVVPLVAAIVLLAALVAGAMVSEVRAQEGDETLLATTNPSPFSHQIEVATDGEIVAWTEVETQAHAHGVVTGNLQIVAVRLADRTRFVVQRTIEGDYPGTSYTDLDVSGDAFIWTTQEYDESGAAVGPVRLELARPWTGPGALLASGPENTRFNAVLDGDWAVWSEGIVTMARNVRTLNAPVVLHDGSNGVFEGIVTNGLAILRDERIDAQQGWREARLLAVPLGEPGALPVIVAEVGQFSYETELHYDADGGLLVYSTNFNRHVFGGERMTVWTVDLATGETDRADVDHPYGYHRGLSTDGRYVYAAYQTGESFPEATTSVYDLVTDSIFILRPSNTIDTTAMEAGRYVWIREPEPGSPVREIRASDRRPWLPSAPIRSDAVLDPGAIWFPETRHSLQLGFKAFWERNGALPVFGYPLTEEYVERNRDAGFWPNVQYTERQRFEWHPGNAGTPYEVQLGRLGAELLLRQGRDWTAFPTADPTMPHYVDQTGHAIDGRFWNYWSACGLELGDPGVSYRESVALFGYPLSEPMMETNVDGDTVLTQYFERAVFEYHLDNPAEYQVLLRRLGVEMLEQRGW